jgi:hypothetical protein
LTISSTCCFANLIASTNSGFLTTSGSFKSAQARGFFCNSSIFIKALSASDFVLGVHIFFSVSDHQRFIASIHV